MLIAHTAITSCDAAFRENFLSWSTQLQAHLDVDKLQNEVTR